MNKKVPVRDLKPGMFVAELDRPWLDTPFLLQGFLIETADQLAELSRCCTYVLVDPHRSVGEAYEPPPKIDKRPVLTKRSASDTVIISTQALPPAANTRSTAPKESALDDIRSIFKESFGDRQAAEPATSKRTPTPEETLFFQEVIQPKNRKPPAPPTSSAGIAAEQPAARSAPAQPQGAGVVHILPATPTKKKSGFFQQVVGLFRAPAYTEPEPEVSGTGGQAQPVNLTIYADQSNLEEELPQAREIQQKAEVLIQDVMQSIQRGRLPEIEKVDEAVSGMVESIVRNPDAMMWLTRLKTRDNYSYGHAIDVSVYVITFGRHLGFPREQLDLLGMGGLLQDVGKIKVAQQILDKKGMLTPEEFQLVKAHVDHSLEILRQSPGTPPEVLSMVAEHHERFDGSGYPRGLAGAQIGLFGAMAGITDCFEALTTTRPHAAPVSAHEALQSMYSWREKFFDATLIEQFIQCIGIFPVGTLVEMNTGDVGVVMAQNKIRRLKPQVMLLLDPNKNRYSSPITLDLITAPLAYGDTPFEIRRSLPSGAYDFDPREFYL